MILVLCILTLAFSLLTVKGSRAGSLEFSFPSEDADLEGISWAEAPIDETGSDFVIPYEAWEIQTIALRPGRSEEAQNDRLNITITDSSGGIQNHSYAISDLSPDEDGLVWLPAGDHVQAGNLKLHISKTGSGSFSIISFAQEGFTDENGNTVFMPAGRIRAAFFSRKRAACYSAVWIAVLTFALIGMRAGRIPVGRAFLCLYALLGILSFSMYPPLRGAGLGQSLPTRLLYFRRNSCSGNGRK